MQNIARVGKSFRVKKEVNGVRFIKHFDNEQDAKIYLDKITESAKLKNNLDVRLTTAISKYYEAREPFWSSNTSYCYRGFYDRLCTFFGDISVLEFSREAIDKYLTSEDFSVATYNHAVIKIRTLTQFLLSNKIINNSIYLFVFQP